MRRLISPTLTFAALFILLSGLTAQKTQQVKKTKKKDKSTFTLKNIFPKDGLSRLTLIGAHVSR